MSETKKPRSITITVKQIVEIDSAIASLGGMDMLFSEIAYILGRLGQYCASITKLVNKERDKLIMKHRADLKSENKEKQKAAMEAVNGRLDKLYSIEETIEIPELKLSDFTAKSDRSITTTYADGSKTTREFKEGEQLVPQMFFTAFGKLIKDDKNVGKFTLPEKESNIFKALEEEDLSDEPTTGEEREIRNKLDDKKASVEVAQDAD